jgi:hypothetical protein
MSVRALLVVIAIAVGLTGLFWGPLWQGHGLIGGDLYTYFFPQKLVYADQLADGKVPLWNDLVGFGYPLLAESQAGVFYPPNPWLYRQFDINTAYSLSQLGHYVLALVFCVLLLRRLDLSPPAAVLGGIVFVYGWFPPRICLEWAIIGGVYFPLSLWCVESYLQSAKLRWLVILALAQGVHLLAGHFNLAFITQLTCVAYAALRVWFVRGEREGKAWVGEAPAEPARRTGDVLPSGSAGASPSRIALMPVVLIIAALGFGFALAAIQLLPTWELKQLSQRDAIGKVHDPGYGHIPPWYLSQIVAPWLWYPADMDPDQALQSIRVATIASATNKVEAHLYFGMLPLLLIAYRLIAAVRVDPLDRRQTIWLGLGLAAMVYATGWLLPITRHLPGFSFFMGPGRYGIVTTLAAALLAGAGLDRLLSGRMRGRSVIIGVVIGLTVADLYWVSRRVFYAEMTPDPPIQHVEESEVRRRLAEYEQSHGPLQPVRMLAPGPNWATLTGYAAYPAYLGIGPAEYFDPQLIMPEPTDEMTPAEQAAARQAQHEWLRQGAFTHVLSMEPLDETEWPQAELVWQGVDRLLNPVYARWREPIFLYELGDSLPRVRLTGDGTLEAQPSTREELALTLTAPEPTELIRADLAYPGWTAHVAGEGGTRTIETTAGLFRRVPVPAGNAAVVWEYDPASFRNGAMISGISFALLWIACGHWLLRRRAGGRGTASTTPPPSSAG